MAQALIFHYRQADNFLTRLNPAAKLVCLLSYSITVSSALPLAVYPLFLLCLIAAAAIKLPWGDPDSLLLCTFFSLAGPCSNAPCRHNHAG